MTRPFRVSSGVLTAVLYCVLLRWPQRGHRNSSDPVPLIATRIRMVMSHDEVPLIRTMTSVVNEIAYTTEFYVMKPGWTGD